MTPCRSLHLERPRWPLAVLLIAATGCRDDGGAHASLPPAASATAAPSAAAAPAACPGEMTQVEGYCIDRWEAHLVREDGAPHPAAQRPRAGRAYRAASVAGVLPQGYLSRIEATAACTAAGKRLCRAREWYRACAGARRTVMPYGNEIASGRCNTGKAHLMTKLFGTVHFTYDGHYNSPKLADEPGFLAPTGEHTGCVSEAGALDMVGNLHEWVADDVSGRLAREIPIEAGAHMLGSEGSGAFMGGYFSSHGEHGRGCAYITATHAPDYHDYSTGFRCCADAR